MSHAIETPVVISKAVAEWLSKNVLTPTYVKSCGGIDLIRLCACQLGQCGHCGHGDHAKCTTDTAWRGNPPGQPATHLVGRTGAALVPVWLTDSPCRWICPCPTCAERRTRHVDGFEHIPAPGRLMAQDNQLLLF